MDEGPAPPSLDRVAYAYGDDDHDDHDDQRPCNK